MIQLTNKANCCGCNACGDACAHRAITFKADREGFWYPEVDAGKCVECGLCELVCPILHRPQSHEPLTIYSGWSKDERVRIGSSSGGAFTEIAKLILAEGGVVFGCALNKELKAVHTYVENIDDLRDKLTGSKYVQSRMEGTYNSVKKFLNGGGKVLFSGTPCQVAGLRNYLRKDYPNLYTVDILCHGVPSPLMFEEYKQYMAKAHKFHVEDVKFRCKKSSWIFYNMTLKGHVENQHTEYEYDGHLYQDPFLRGFLSDVFLRPSCHTCRFTTVDRVSDFTIADWWGYQPLEAESRDCETKGVSLLFLNTNKAQELQLQLQTGMQLRERTLQDALQTNGVLTHPSRRSPLREQFWKDYEREGFAYLVQQYMQPARLGLVTKIQIRFKPSKFRDALIFIVCTPFRLLQMAKSLMRVH